MNNLPNRAAVLSPVSFAPQESRYRDPDLRVPGFLDSSYPEVPHHHEEPHQHPKPPARLRKVAIEEPAVKFRQVTPPQHTSTAPSDKDHAKKCCIEKEKSEKPLDLPSAHPKTVAFGRTVNVSQTIEGKHLESLRKKFGVNPFGTSYRTNPVLHMLFQGNKENANPSGKNPALAIEAPTSSRNSTPKSAESDESLKKKVSVLEQELAELRGKVAKLELKDSERAEQLVKISTTLNDLLRRTLSPPRGSQRNTPVESSKQHSRSSQPKQDLSATFREHLALLEERFKDDPIFYRTVTDIIAEEDRRSRRPNDPDSEFDEFDSEIREPRKRFEHTSSTSRRARAGQSPSSPPRRRLNPAASQNPPPKSRTPTVTQRLVFEREVHGLSPRLDDLFSTDTKKYLAENHVLSEDARSLSEMPQSRAFPTGVSYSYHPNRQQNKPRRKQLEPASSHGTPRRYQVDLPEEREFDDREEFVSVFVDTAKQPSPEQDHDDRQRRVEEIRARVRMRESERSRRPNPDNDGLDDDDDDDFDEEEHPPQNTRRSRR